MQVRKFEARSMKEALEMVKSELGPEAVILSARDNSKRFGLVGDGSVEITAAISDEILKRRNALQSKVRPDSWERFQKSPARNQKAALERAYRAKNETVPGRGARYVDIVDDQDDEWVEAAPDRSLHEAKKAFLATSVHRAKGGSHEEEVIQSAPAAYPRNARVKAAVSQAFEALRETSEELSAKQEQKKIQKAQGADTSGKDHEIASLKNEISGLKKMIEQFHALGQAQTKSTYPGADYDLPYELSPSFVHLTETAGILPEYAAEILTSAEENIDRIRIKKKAVVEAFVAQKIYDTLKLAPEGQPAKTHIFVGGRGSGKTASIIKQAAHWALQGKKVAVLTTDTVKVGAIDQLRIYTQILNIPFGVLRDSEDWALAMNELGGVDHVLVDFPGMSLKSNDEMQFLYRMLPPQARLHQHAIHLVVSATKKDADIAEVAKRYSQVGFDDVIFTSLDEVTQHGVIYNFQKTFSKPLHSFGIGPRIPEDFEVATKERVVDLIFRITDDKKQNS